MVCILHTWDSDLSARPCCSQIVLFLLLPRPLILKVEQFVVACQPRRREMLIRIRSFQFRPASVAEMLPALPTCHLQLLISASSFLFTDSHLHGYTPNFFPHGSRTPGRPLLRLVANACLPALPRTGALGA